uniref:FeoB small GTPase domain-containing protein n=1 Tax=uncultured Desulfovibrio sp. TaxID=167968 RepID=UPI00258F6603
MSAVRQFKAVEEMQGGAPGAVRIALAGNPNCGKTTVFNGYTGARQHVGNYPGVTVDRKEGRFVFNGESVTLVDLPGTYSLTAYSQEELVARRELAGNNVQAVIDVVDSSALERNLLLTVQMLEMGMPVVLACNMMDEARAAGIHIDMERLGRLLGIPVLPMVARTGEGLKKALETAISLAREDKREPLRLSYGSDLDGLIVTLEKKISEGGLLARQDVVDSETYAEDLSSEIGLVTPAYSLYINGERLGATTYEGALDELLAQLQAAATNENTISCSFAEDVEIKYEYVPTSEVMNLGYLAELLNSTKTGEVTYTVVEGDTWSEIAESHGMTSQELLALNPGYDINKIQIGEVLTISNAVPYLTLTLTQRERYVAQIPYDVEYQDSAYLYKGDYKVVSAGQYGSADVVANVTYVNGEEVERTILSSVTLQEPVTEQRLQGTKERPTWLPTGSFRWPCSGS